MVKKKKKEYFVIVLLLMDGVWDDFYKGEYWFFFLYFKYD